MITSIIDQLKRDEGFRPNIYVDTMGKHTIGYGHNLDANPLPFTSVTEAQAEDILRKDVDPITNRLVHLLPWTDTLGDPRFGVLQNMSFNMGLEGLVGFHHMLSFAQQQLFAYAAQAMQQSKWYTEVGDRAVRLEKQMAMGVWQ